MKIKSLIWLMVAMLLIAAPGFSQDTKKAEKKPQKFKGPDFSGTYVLDEGRSHDIEVNVYKLALPKLPKPEPNQKITNLMVIDQKEFEFKATIKRRIETFDAAGKLEKTDEIVQSESTFYGDKRGEKNKFNTDKIYESVTTQNGREIVVSIKVDPKRRVYNLITFALSKDGRELTYDSSGYKLEPDYTLGQTYVSPTALRSKKFYIKLNQ
jgi:hypothetical protein